MGVTTSSTVAATYEPIASQTISGTSTSSITFGSGNTLTQAYTDLVLVSQGLITTAGYATVRFNGDSGSNYSRTYVQGDGSTAASARSTNVTENYISLATATQSVSVVQFFNYSNSNVYKTSINRDNNPSSATIAQVNLWRNTNAITQITIAAGSGNFGNGLTFTLYGIKAA